MRMRGWMTFGMACAVSIGAGSAALAGPRDYRFEAVRAQVPATATTTIVLRIVHLPDGRPVAGARLSQPKMEMPMQGMAPMATRVSAMPPDDKGDYPFVADLAGGGPWTLTVSATIPGEAAPIVGSVPFMAVP